MLNGARARAAYFGEQPRVSSHGLRAAFRFFLERAGYSVPPGRAVCAMRLARAEYWVRSQSDLCYLEQEDERAYCYCEDKRCKYHEDSKEDWSTISIALVRECEEHGIDCKHAEYLTSLSGIMDPDEDYRRVVRAELALEVMPEDEQDEDRTEE